MNTEIKKFADSGDIKSLKYIFVDSLDVDPTFVRYEEEYNYCKSIPGLFEPYVELTPLSENKANWTEEYWTHLKMDLIKNFSDKRMSHMRDVAQVFLADKVQRILAERATNQKIQQSIVLKAEPVQIENIKNIPSKLDIAQKELSISKTKFQARQLQEKKRERKVQNKSQQEGKTKELAAKTEQPCHMPTQANIQTGDGFLKKSDRSCSSSYSVTKITQSHRMAINTPTLAQVNQREHLVSGTAVNENTDALPLVRNNLHQIFQTKQCIFKVSSTFEKLYRYKFDCATNEVIEIVVYKRVKADAPELKRFQYISTKKTPGKSTPFCDKTYSIFSLISQGNLRGYMLCSKDIYDYYQLTEPHKIYFTYEKYEKKGR